ncbi:MAG: hypothetical protein QM648_05590 [Solirubrobacterales bacterium]
MADLPATYDVAAGFVPAKPIDAWEHVRDIDNWPRIFPGWIARVEEDDERWHVTGPRSEKYDFYPRPESEQRAMDVEVVDELGSADTLRLRVLDMPGGALVVVAHGRLSGTSDSAWAQKRDSVAEGLSALSLD